ncbi:MAG: EcsC family protein, partial [Chitinophagaceae bacterium]
MEFSYEQVALTELKTWQRKMLKAPSSVNKLAKAVQDKINSWIPEKIHAAVTAAIKQMIRAVLFGSQYTTGKPIGQGSLSLEIQETRVRARIEFYKKTAAAEGGITGAGGI